MKKKIFLFGALLLGLTACSDEVPDGGDKAQRVDPSELTLITDQNTLASRMVFKDVVNNGASTRAALPSAHEAEPAIPTDAKLVKDQETNWNGGVKLSANGNYYIAAGEVYTGSISIPNAGDGVNLYIAGTLDTTGVQDWLWWDENQKVTIYVLSGGAFKHALDGSDFMIHIRKNTVIKCWGEFDTTRSDRGIKVMGALYLFKGSGTQLYVHNGVSNIDWAPTFQVDDDGIFYSELPVYVEGSTKFNGGNSRFVSTFHTVGNCWFQNSGKVVFEDCAEVERMTYFSSSSTIDVYTKFQTNILNTVEHARADFRLHNALLQVDTDAFIDDALVTNVFTGEGSDYSVFNVDGTLYIDGTNGADQTFGWEDKRIVHMALKSVEGNMDIHAANMRIANYSWKPEDTEWQKFDLTEASLVLESGVIMEGDTYLTGGTSGCGAYGEKPKVEITELVEILPPTGDHKFSATGFDFGPDGLLYLGWHANPKFETGTAGYMDVIKISNYNIENSLFEQSLLSDEFRFNHTMYSDGVIYGATTSLKVGAALAKISVESDGLIRTDPDVRRVNLTGGSSNCVEMLGSNLVSISGWKVGGVDILDKDADKPYRTLNEGAYMGKFVFYNASQNEIVTLHDTDNGTVEIYNASDKSLDGLLNTQTLSFNAGELSPRDGKNVCISDAQYIYVCRGQKGLSVYNRSGQLVAETGVSANGVDVDDQYIYVAAGAGVVVYEKSQIDGGTPVHLKAIAKKAINGKTTLQDVSSEIGESANFIRKGADGRLYVAYGVYGLRIYKLDKHLE